MTTITKLPNTNHQKFEEAVALAVAARPVEPPPAPEPTDEEQLSIKSSNDELDRWACAMNSTLVVEQAKGNENFTRWGAYTAVEIHRLLTLLYISNEPAIFPQYLSNSLGAGFKKTEVKSPETKKEPATDEVAGQV